MSGLLSLGSAKMLDDLMTYNARHAGITYALGHHDCFLYAVRWADIVRSERVRDLYRYSGSAGAARALVSAGVRVAHEKFDQHYDRTDAPYPGDIVAWTEGDKMGACGIYAGNGISYTVSTSATGVVSTDEPHNIAWRV